MAVTVGINGYGRIGRNILRAIYESGCNDTIRVAAISDLADAETDAYLTQYDTAHGPFPGEVRLEDDHLVVNGDRIAVLANQEPDNLPWGELGVDIVFECTGRFASRDKALGHVAAGAGKVIISAPAGTDLPTIVYGVNHEHLQPEHEVISNASCTTNCLAPLVKPLHDALGVEHGVMNTIHAYTNDQVLTDVYHKDLRRARSATHNMIPAGTGAAAAIGQVLPELDGKLEGFAVRVPTINVSMVDLTITAGRETSAEEVNTILRRAAEAGPLEGVLRYNDKALVSSDFNHDPASSIVEASLTRVTGSLVKVCAWYDNEWGFSNRMVDTALAFSRV